MQATALALTGFIAWYIVLTIAIVSVRGFLAATGKREANSFSNDGTDISDLAARICRAHANCYESFALIGGALLLALATDSSDITDGLAFALLGARFAQSAVHIASGSAVAAQIRFGFYFAQLGIVTYWLVLLACQFVA